MQVQQLLRSSDAVSHHGQLGNVFLSRSKVHLEAQRRLPAMRIRRKGPQSIRFLSEGGRVGSKTSGGGLAANGLGFKDLDAREEHLSSTGTAPLPPATSFRDLNYADHHLLVLGFIACTTTGALSCLLLASIPTLLAMKKAAESLGKLADTAREELPTTMAAVRLSGMEISDLTMELSDLGQEISAGVRSSSRAVRAAEDGLRRIGNFTSSAVLQERVSGQVKVVKPAVARAARNTREALVRARTLVTSLITLTRLSSWLGHWWKLLRPWQQKVIPVKSG